jgi:hypothetical protein
MAAGALSWWCKAESGVDNPVPFSATAKKEHSYICTPHLHLHGMSLETFTCLIFTSRGSFKQKEMNRFYKTFMALQAVTLEVTVFWDAVPCYLVHSY